MSEVYKITVRDKDSGVCQSICTTFPNKYSVYRTIARTYIRNVDTHAPIGYLYAFKTLDLAVDFINSGQWLYTDARRENIVIWKCKANVVHVSEGNIRRLMVSENFERIKRFWDTMKPIIHRDTTAYDTVAGNRAPRGTVYCKWVKPLQAYNVICRKPWNDEITGRPYLYFVK